MAKYFILFLFLCFSRVACAQEIGFTIENLNIVDEADDKTAVGTKKKRTKSEHRKKKESNYLRYFVKSTPGTLLNKNTLEQDCQQLIRRAGISHAYYNIDTLDQQRVNVRFKVRRQLTLIPQFGIGGVRNNFWWQIGAAEFNLGGTGQTLIATYLQTDRRPNYKLFYENNWIKGTPWGFSLDVARFASIEPLFFPEATVQYLYTNNGIGMTGIRNFGFNHRLDVGATLFQEDYKKNNLVPGVFTPGPDSLVQNKLLLKANFNVNKLKYKYFYNTGHQLNLLTLAVFTKDDPLNFNSITFEAKKFWRAIPTVDRPEPKGNFALRLRLALATNTNSPFAPFVLDSRFNIRGVGNRIDRGTAQFVLNLEYRQTLFHAPRWAAQAIVFSDLGSWREPGGKLKDLLNKGIFRQFAGLGVRLIDKKVFRSILRFDYGVDLFNPAENGPVLGIGQYF